MTSEVGRAAHVTISRESVPDSGWGTVYVVALVFVAIIAAEILWILIWGQEALNVSVGATAVLGLLTAAAVGIERFTEFIWTLIGSRWGSYWPLRHITHEVQRMIDELSAELESLGQEASHVLSGVRDSAPDRLATFADIATNPERFDAAEREFASVKGRFDQLVERVKAAPTNQGVQLLVTAAAFDVDVVYKKYEDALPELRWANTSASRAINALQDFTTAFKDNPGRRLLSLLLGVVIGLALTGSTGLDLISAALGSQLDNPQLGIILSGLIIGLGANPTHEVIRAIQEHKEGAKGRNSERPSLDNVRAGRR